MGRIFERVREIREKVNRYKKQDIRDKFRMSCFLAHIIAADHEIIPSFLPTFANASRP